MEVRPTNIEFRRLNLVYSSGFAQMVFTRKNIKNFKNKKYINTKKVLLYQYTFLKFYIMNIFKNR